MAERTVDYFKQKTWCDAKDGLGVWRLGRVKKKQKHKVLVHFDGWSDKWKQWHCVHSNMIAPLRKYSKGYTGQSKVALREWDFNDEYLKIVEGKIKILLHNKFEGFSPYDLAVLLRGDLFVLVDSLLTYTYNDPSKDYARVSDFFGLILELIIRWMQTAPDVFAEQQRFADQPDAYLLNNSVAIYKSGNELLETFNSIMGNNPRTNRFYERKELGANPSTLIQNFVRKNGIKAVTGLLTSQIPVQDIWGLLVHLPKLLLGSEALGSAKKPVTEMCEGLFRKLDALNSDTGGVFPTADRVIFTSKLEQLLRQVYTPNVANERMLLIRAKLQIEVPSPILPAVNAPSKEEIRGAPRKQPLTVKTDLDERRLDRHYEFSPDPEGGASDDPFSDQRSMIEHDEEHDSEALVKLRDYIDSKFKQCMEAIAGVASTNKLQGNDYRLQEVFKEHGSCDQQEFAVLSAVETLMTENELPKALKLLRWRKKVLKIAAISGWEAARLIAKKTVDTMEITGRDLIEENLKAWSFVSDHSLNGPGEIAD